MVMHKIKIRLVHKLKNRRLLLFAIITLLLPQLVVCNPRTCDRQPEGHVAQKSPSDGRFRLRIEGNPEEYTPGRDYTVVLQGIKSHRNAHAFIGFMIVVEKATSEPEDFLLPDTASAGTFSLVGDNLSKFSDKCPNAVTQTSAIQKRDVRIIWRAPTVGSGCVVFRATVVEHRDVWYMDDDHLVITLCKDEQDTIEKQPIILDRCCACKEAKYELKFERVWSRHTHPKDFPSDALSTRFSDIIGASHAVNYRFWEYGRAASLGLKQLSEHGSTRDLETELKSQSESIRTIIKARGVTQANVTGKSFAVFRVDSKNHLISLVSMIDPSPDWIVGVSGLELCRDDCSWVENKTIKLFPWDAGTDSGPSYLSPDQPTNPPDVLRRITQTFPNDQNSPFYDPTGVDMKPMALLHITRQRLYDKNCEEANQNEDDDLVTSNACDTTPWGEWTECNVRCGRGQKRRNRNYIDPIRAEETNCKAKLMEKQKCFGTDTYCDGTNENTNPNHNPNGFPFEMDPQNTNRECELTEWSSWTPCSVSCGRGVRTRDRQYKNRHAMKKCRAGSANPPELQDTEECNGDSCVGDISTVKNIDARRCRTTKWSHWSPCSVTCGVGEKMRTRKLLESLYNRHSRRQARYTSNFNYRNNNNDGNNEEEEQDDEEDDTGTVVEGESRRGGSSMFSSYPTTVGGSGPCASMELIQIVKCGQEQPSCDSYRSQPFLCRLPPDVGSCRNPSSRYFYDPSHDDCAIFFYGGCNGNENNFETYDDCRSKCRLARD